MTHRSLPVLRILLVALSCGAAGLFAQEPSPPAPAQTPFPSPAANSAPRELLDLPYVTGGHERQRLDLYLPASDGKAAHPLVVWIHGGGWESGSKSYCPAKGLTARGYVVASIGYRLSQHAIFPAQIEDCKAAIRWLRAHTAQYSIDPARIGASGESAGGHLVALLGTTGHDRQFDVGENLDQSSAVQCVIDFYGPSDFLHWSDPPATEPPAHEANTALTRLIGGPVRTHLDTAHSASSIYFVDKDAAPFLILHGDKDNTVPLQQSRILNAALHKAGVESTLEVLPGAGHGGKAFWEPEMVKRMVDFLDRHLGTAKAPATPIASP